MPSFLRYKSKTSECNRVRSAFNDTSKIDSSPLPGPPLCYSHAGVKLEVSGLVSKGKVVLCQFRFGGVKCQLVAGQPALIAQHGSCVDGGPRHVEVQVAAHVDKVTLVASLQLGALLAVNVRERSCVSVTAFFFAIGAL